MGIAVRVASPKLVMEEAPDSYKDVNQVCPERSRAARLGLAQLCRRREGHPHPPGPLPRCPTPGPSGRFRLLPEAARGCRWSGGGLMAVGGGGLG